MRRVLLSSLFLLFCVVMGAGLWFRDFTSVPAPGEGTANIEIPKGAGVRRIGELLVAGGVLRSDDIRFLALVRLKDVAGRLRAGEYNIPRGLVPEEVLHILEKGEVVQHSVTVPEGLRIEQIGEIFAREGWVDPVLFVKLAKDREVAHSLGVEQDGLEGYLFPDTYFLTKGSVEAISVLRMMTERFFTVLSGLPTHKLKGLSLHELVILASMVEKETGAAFERPLIAGVFLNRLERKMRLQSDPTVIYGIENFNGNLTRKDLRTPSPYNTYVIPALPAGPICNPGRDALDAVLSPAQTTALYFVSKNDGTHVFSDSLKAHNRAVYKYQKNFKARN